MNIRQVISLTGMSRTTIMDRIRDGTISPPQKPVPLAETGWYYNFSKADVAKLLRSKRPAGRPVGWRKNKPTKGKP